jgi:hypothetical protein
MAHFIPGSASEPSSEVELTIYCRYEHIYNIKSFLHRICEEIHINALIVPIVKSGNVLIQPWISFQVFTVISIYNL